VTRLSAEKDNLRFELEHLDGSADERQLLLAAIMDVLDMLDGTPPDGPWRLSRALGRFGADSAHRPVMLATEAVLAAWRGEHGEAARLADTLLAVDSDGRQERMRMLQLLVGAAQGDQSSGTKLRGCLYTSRNAGDTVMTALCLYTLATQSVLCQDSIKGNQLLEAALGPLSTRDLRGPFRAALQAAGTLALETDDLQRAKDCFTLLLRESDHAHHRALAFEGFALLAVSERRYDHGLRLLSAAETVAGPTRWPAADWWRKRVEEARAKAHDALSPTQANAALAFGRALTAARVTDYALDVKSAKGATEPDGEILSQREWDVAILVSQGLTNRQIGARLYLSVRTVEAHMRNIRMTLGLSTRAHVAAWTAERRGTMLKRHG
jgi:DNA-binding CsgD family transcriptional regulator